MSFVERVNQGESLVSWLNCFYELPAVCWSLIMGDLSPSRKGVNWTLPEAFRTGPPSCAVHSMTSLCGGNPPGTDGFPSQRAVTRKTFPFDDVILSYRWMRLVWHCVRHLESVASDVVLCEPTAGRMKPGRGLTNYLEKHKRDIGFSAASDRNSNVGGTQGWIAYCGSSWHRITMTS